MKKMRPVVFAESTNRSVIDRGSVPIRIVSPDIGGGFGNN